MSVYCTVYTPVSSSYFTGTLACSFILSDLYYTYQIGIHTLSKIFQEVCKTIWEELQLSCVSVPSQEEWLQISQQFEQHTSFADCVGCVGGKQVRKAKPADSESLYYKRFFSVVLLAVYDANYHFTFVDIVAYGKNFGSPYFPEQCVKK